jgi:2-oxo-4-hydroxy-4-carboxy--5-ureidoimidazoline (OHCU) decarboxylase
LDVIDQGEAFVYSLLDCHDRTSVLAIINAHPKIGADPKTLSADSKKEQGTTGDPVVLSRLKDLNEAYEARYGFRFVVFVNGRSKEEIIPVLEQRLSTGNVEDEMRTAAKVICIFLTQYQC